MKHIHSYYSLNDLYDKIMQAFDEFRQIINSAGFDRTCQPVESVAVKPVFNK